MEWENTPESSNIEDRRGGQRRRCRRRAATGGLGIGAILIVLVISYFTGINPAILLGGAQIVTGNGGTSSSAPAPSRPGRPPAPNDRMTSLVRHVLGETEAVWTEVLPAQKGVRYTDATLVLYNGATRVPAAAARRRRWGRSIARSTRRSISTCRSSTTCRPNTAAAAISPTPMSIAHEIGHHVQDLLGILDKVDDAKQRRLAHAGQRAFGARRTSGRLLRRRLGRPRQQEMEQPARAPTTSRRRSRPRGRSATTVCRRPRAAMPCPTVLPTDPRRCASNG